jgi:hypothetical protein
VEQKIKGRSERCPRYIVRELAIKKARGKGKGRRKKEQRINSRINIDGPVP